MSELMNLRPILNPKKEFGDYIKLAWYFRKPHEKLFLVALTFWGMYAVYKIFWVGCP